MIAANLVEAGVRGDDIVINLVDIPKENWSPGRGEMAYPPQTDAAMDNTRRARDEAQPR